MTTTHPRRRFFRYSLRTLFVVVTGVSYFDVNHCEGIHGSSTGGRDNSGVRRDNYLRKLSCTLANQTQI